MFEGPEALEWLRKNGQIAALASNRFSSTAEAILFVEKLYGAGAKKVSIAPDSIIDDEEERELGGPYSDTLILEVEGPEIPPNLLTLYRNEATLEGYDLQKETPPLIENRYLILWWD